MYERKLSRRDFVSYSAIALPLAAAQRRKSCDGSPDIPPLLDGFSPVIDCHSHIGVDHANQHVTATAGDCVAMMDRCGIERACTSARERGCWRRSSHWGGFCKYHYDCITCRVPSAAA